MADAVTAIRTDAKNCACGRVATITLDARRRDVVPALDTVVRDALAMCDSPLCAVCAEFVIRRNGMYVVAGRRLGAV